MVTGSASTSARSPHGVDRFYNPPAVRRQLEEQRLRQQLEEQKRRDAAAATAVLPPVHKPARPKPRHAPAPAPARSPDLERRVESDASSSAKPSTSSCSSPPPVPSTPEGNLDRFLKSTTLSVSAQYFSKRGMKGWRNCKGLDSNPYFNLGDLWDSFGEWSAYGAGVPLVLNGSDCVVQYYVPYLSGIQLYANSPKPASRSRRLDEESDGELCVDSSSDCSSENEIDRLTRERRSASGVISRVAPEGFLNDDGEISRITIVPVFEYFERDPPYGREPLSDKISLLADRFPGLKSYNSCDLLPYSWISVAWYPIYRIPTGPTLKDLDACFLTFHNLATPSKAGSNGYPDALASCGVGKSLRDINGKLSLHTFGLALYKFKSSIWTSDALSDHELAASLLQVADKWLRILGAEHPDFQFFMSHYNVPWR